MKLSFKDSTFSTSNEVPTLNLVVNEEIREMKEKLAKAKDEKEWVKVELRIDTYQTCLTSK